MGFSIAEYRALRPTLWHLTHRQNLELTRKSRDLKPADLLASANLDAPRRGREIVHGLPVLRDQDLLHEKNIAFELGFSMRDLLRELNRRVFFWPGSVDRPSKSGQGAIHRFSDSD